MRSEQGKQKKPIKMSTALLILAVIAAAVVLAVVIVIGMSGSEENKNAEKQTQPTQQVIYGDEELGIDATVDEQLQNYRNVVLFGIDAEDLESETGHRSDAIIVLSMNKETDEVKMFSVYRDTYLKIDDEHGLDKINHAYAYGGPELAIKTLNQNFNLDIRNYVTVNFYQMAEIVDAFGGVDIQLTAEEVYSLNENLWNLSQESPGSVVSSDFIPNVNGEIDLINGPYQDGEYHLNGNQAVAYARIRHLDSDNVRASRQQTVLQALLTSLKKKNIFQLPGLVRKVFSVCETSLNVGDMLGMSPIAFGGLNLETLSIPGEEEQAYGATLDSGAWVYEYDLTAASQHINRFIYEEESPYYTGAE